MNPNDMHLLVVEDDPDGQEYIGRMLRFNKIPYDGVYTAEDALELLSNGTYTGAIIDLNLPGMDGWTLLNAIQHNLQLGHLPCVAVTAYHSAELAIKTIEAGFAAYFPKPLETTSFVREIQRMMLG